MQQIFIIATCMGFISLIFLLTVKRVVNIPNTRAINYFFIPVGCILSLMIIILGVYGLLQ